MQSHRQFDQASDLVLGAQIASLLDEASATKPSASTSAYGTCDADGCTV